MGSVNLTEKLKQVHEVMAVAARRAGRAADEINLVAVSKTRTVAEIRVVQAAGVVDFGENYAQEMVAKADEMAAETGLCWHFIGHLQRNKVRDILPVTALLHTVDSERLAVEVNRRAGDLGQQQAVLLQVDLAGEATKYGCPEEQLLALVEKVLELPHLQWQGLMTMPPLAADPEATRPYYRRLAKWRQQLIDEGVAEQHLCHLSMGLSHDYPVAIEEGATLIRVGTAIFGPRS